MREPKKRIKGTFFPFPDELMKSELAEYLGVSGLTAYTMLGLKWVANWGTEGEHNLILTYKEAGRFMIRRTFSRAIFRLWAYRVIKVVNWGRRGREPSRYALFNKWKTLIRMPEKLNTIHVLVNEYENIQKHFFIPEQSNPKTRTAFYSRKREKLVEIKRKIINVKL